MEAISAGHICLDIIPDLSGHLPGQFAPAFLPGRLLHTGPAALSTGGSVSNTGLALHKFGLETRLVAKTGDDEFGSAIRRLVASRAPGLEAGLAADPQASTSYSIVISPPGQDRTFLHHPGANDQFSAVDVPLDDIRAARLFHFGYPPIMARMYANGGEELVRMFRLVKALGLTTSLDMAYPDPDSPGGRVDWQDILRRTLPFVDIFTPSLEEILFLMGRRDSKTFSPEVLEQVSGLLLNWGAKIILLKLGSRGLYLHAAQAEVLWEMGKARPANIKDWGGFKTWQPCFQAQVAGTTGAGDVTTAGFLAALLRGLPPEKSVDFALAAGACCVEAPDALGGLRSWEDTWRRIEAGWEKQPAS